MDEIYRKKFDDLTPLDLGPTSYPAEIAFKQLMFLNQCTSINEESRILDIGCGSGVHLKPLQLVTHSAYGVDLNLTANPPIPNSFECDVFRDDLSPEINNLALAFCFTPYFGSDWWNLEVLLAKVHRLLRKNGIFVLDLYHLHAIPEGDRVESSFKTDEGKTQTSWYQRTGDRYLLWDDWCFKENGGEPKVWRIFARDEIQDIFRSCGLDLTTECSNFDLGLKADWAIHENKELWKRLCVVGEKR